MALHWPQIENDHSMLSRNGDSPCHSVTQSLSHSLTYRQDPSCHRQQPDMHTQSTVQTAVASGQHALRFWNSTTRPTWSAAPTHHHHQGHRVHCTYTTAAP